MNVINALPLTKKFSLVSACSRTRCEGFPLLIMLIILYMHGLGVRVFAFNKKRRRCCCSIACIYLSIPGSYTRKNSQFWLAQSNAILRKYSGKKEIQCKFLCLFNSYWLRLQSWPINNKMANNKKWWNEQWQIGHQSDVILKSRVKLNWDVLNKSWGRCPNATAHSLPPWPLSNLDVFF